MDPEVYKEVKDLEKAGDFQNPRYGELLFEHYYTQHFLRRPVDQWPESVLRSLKHLNNQIYVHMQGYSEFGITGDATLKEWDISGRLKELTVPTLVIGSGHDTMDPDHMEWMSGEVLNGRYLFCANGSHLSQYDDQETYFNGVIQFIEDVDSGKF
jgi:proline iminopeptidase